MNMNKTLKTLMESRDWMQATKLIASITTDSINTEFAILAASTFFEISDYPQMFTWIQKGLYLSHDNYELYLLLGMYYESINPNQAYLCYENALFYCNDAEDRETIQQFADRLTQTFPITVNKVSIVILSYNSREMTQQCIESIRATTPASSYKIIVVDNNSSDDSVTYLKEQEDIVLLCNSANVGFPAGCNQGILASSPDNDIFLLNNDTIVTPNSIFQLRMGLYDSDNVGSVGSVTNCAVNGQMIQQTFSTVQEYYSFAKKINIPSRNPYEIKMWLVGFALLIKREALDSVGLLDENFSPGCYEDNDLGIRLQLAKWKSYLCHNSFIFHYGHGGGANSDTWLQISSRNYEYLKQKWGNLVDFFQ